MVRIRHTRGTKAPSVEEFSRSVIRFGSAPASDVVFYGEANDVVPEHAEIREEDGRWVLVDLGSRIGTSVGGAAVTRVVLASGDLVRLGGAGGPEFEVELGGAGDGKMDLAAAQRLVQDAVGRASLQDDKIERLVAKKVADAKRRANYRNAVLAVGTLLALIGALVTATMVWRAQQKATELVSEAGLDKPRAAKRPTAPDEPATVASKTLSGRQIYEENKSALFVLGYTHGRTVGAFCTAFAIGPSTLATNAHCVNSARERRSMQLVATQNDSGGKVRFKILGTTLHPEYRRQSRSADSPDVGLVKVQGTLPKVVTLASDAELRSIGAGDDAYVLGFPGRVMDPISPSATFLQGRVNRVTGFDSGATEPAKSFLVQHDAVTRGGNSGSPIFNQHGHVIALHAAHIDEEEEQQVDGRRTKVMDASPYRIGMRVDLLRGVPRP